METMKSEATKAEQKTGKGQYTRVCERCSTELAAFSNEQSVTLCSTVTTRLCDDCRRDWDVDPHVAKLMLEVNRFNARLSAFVQAGDADNAESSMLAHEAARDAARTYAIKWLGSKIEREEPSGEA